MIELTGAFVFGLFVGAVSVVLAANFGTPKHVKDKIDRMIEEERY